MSRLLRVIPMIHFKPLCFTFPLFVGHINIRARDPLLWSEHQGLMPMIVIGKIKIVWVKWR